MEKGWKAEGLIRPLYKKAGGRDALARKAQASPQTLSAIEGGRQNLGEALARRLAAAAGITLAELGAPEGVLEPRDRSILGRLAKLEEEAVRVEDLGLLLRVVALLATGRTSEALRVLKEAGVVPQ